MKKQEMRIRAESAWRYLRAVLTIQGGEYSVRAGATSEQVREAELAFGRRLPESVRAVYEVHNGYSRGSDALLSLDQAQNASQLLKELCRGRMIDRRDRDQTRSGWVATWMPVAADGETNFLCVDLKPPYEAIEVELGSEAPVVRNIRLDLSQLIVEYVSPRCPTEVILPASIHEQKIAELLWEALESRMALVCPNWTPRLPAGAQSHVIGEAEEQLGIEFPALLRELYQIHDGFGMEYHEGPLLMSVSLTVSEWRDRRDSLSGVGRNISCPQDPVQPVLWDDGWIPVAAANGAGDLYCLDLNPAPLGRVGQLISCPHDSAERHVVYPGLVQYLLDGLELRELRFL